MVQFSQVSLLADFWVYESRQAAGFGLAADAFSRLGGNCCLCNAFIRRFIASFDMKLHPILFGLALFLTASQLAAGQGTFIVGHSGSANPTNEGFSLLSSGSPSLAPIMNDLGYNAWSITNRSGADIAEYYQTLTPQQAAELSADWTLSLTLRVGGPIDPAHSGILADFHTGSEYFLLYFGSLSNGDPAVNFQSTQYVLNGAGSGYHNYELKYDTATELATLWSDGSPWVTGIQGAASPNSASLYWGIGQRNSSSSYYANWNEVELLAVPEPSSAVVLLIGGGVLFYVRRKVCR